MKRIIFILLFSLFTFNSTALIPTRVILATDSHKNYIEFWPHVAHWWQKIIGITNITIAAIATEPLVPIANADVIALPAIPGVPTGKHAQMIRLLLPVLYPDEICIIADMDMIPLSRSFFLEFPRNVPDDHFLIYHEYGQFLTETYPEERYDRRYPMCYLAAQGKLFGEIFGITTLAESTKKIKEWHALDLGFSTDEQIVFAAINQWQHFSSRITILSIPDFYEHRIKRIFQYDPVKLINDFYFDSHCPRPYSQHKNSIDTMVQLRLGAIAVARITQSNNNH